MVRRWGTPRLDGRRLVDTFGTGRLVAERLHERHLGQSSRGCTVIPGSCRPSAASTRAMRPRHTSATTSTIGSDTGTGSGCSGTGRRAGSWDVPASRTLTSVATMRWSWPMRWWPSTGTAGWRRRCPGDPGAGFRASRLGGRSLPHPADQPGVAAGHGEGWVRVRARRSPYGPAARALPHHRHR
jgi:hypothetical protein